MKRFWPVMKQGDVYYCLTTLDNEFLFEADVILGQRTNHSCAIEINIEFKDFNNIIVQHDHQIKELRLANDEELFLFFEEFPIPF